MKKLYATLFSALVVGCAVCAGCTTKKVSSSAEVVDIIHKVNGYWQTNHPEHGRSFWDNAAYHTGNMEAYFLTNKPEYLEYSKGWAEHNEWKGAKSDHKANWKYSYGESNDYVLFGDYQICFQTYADLYNLEPDTHKIARAREVMEYQMSTPNNDYWWWADGLYMVMPVMTKLYNITKNPLYLEKLHEYLAYADSIMYDEEAGLYYRDGKYVYPKHKSVNGKKDFWARGDGWVLAGLAKVLKDLPETDKYRQEYIDRFRTLAKSVAACQQPEGLGNQPFAERIGETDWEVALIIPYSVFFKHQIDSLDGKEIKANFYKCGDELQTPHFLSWNPIQIEQPDFHRPDFFGTLEFE